MAIGRISGHLLKSNLLRNGENLAFENDLLYLDVNTQKIGVKKSNPTYELDVDGTIRSNVVIVETIEPTTNTNSIDINASTALTLPAGSELDKLNFTAIPGQIRYNNDLDQFEGFYNSGWSPISSDTTQIVQVITFEKTLLLTDSWADAGINGPDLVSGTYFFEIVVNDEHHTSTTYTGVISWYDGATTDNYQQEIVLVKSGSDSTANIFIRLTNTISPGYAKLQIASTEVYTISSTYTFKFRQVDTTVNTASFSNLASLNVLGSVTSNLNPPTSNNLTVGSNTSPWNKGYFQELYINNTNIIETIDIESSIRANADTSIQNSINDEVSARISADNSIRSLIDNESSVRTNADIALQNAINSEITNRTNADIALQNAINSEITNRTNADTALQSLFSNADNITSGTLLVNRGGTGTNSLTQNAVLIGNGTNPITAISPGTAGNVLTSDGSNWVSQTFSGSGLGVGQSWQDVTASRSCNVTYTNTTGKPIFFWASAVGSSSAGSGSVVVNGITVGSTSSTLLARYCTHYASSTALVSEASLILVPDGQTYRFNYSLNNTPTAWWEYR